MQFKHPELLYALLLLLIPIIIHLFQLRRFKEVAFTNVAFLKQVKLQTRKSSQIKKWLTLLTRLLLVASIVLAFTQPFTSQNNSLNKTEETVIYLDNSFSMQAKGTNGELLQRAIQDIIANIPEEQEFTLFTNTDVYNKVTIQSIRNELLQIPYTANQLSYDALQLKAKRYFSTENTLKNLVLVSDFQQLKNGFKIIEDATINTYLVKLNPVNNNNIAIDSAYISSTDVSSIKLAVLLKNTGQALENLPVSLFHDETLLAKTSVAINGSSKAEFSLPRNQIINGQITINDNQLQYDNGLYFNINEIEKINVLSISNTNDNYLRRIYTDDEFIFTSSKIDRLNYSNISKQDVIVLNELENIPNPLITALQSFSKNNGVLIVVPSKTTDIKSYNNLLLNYGNLSFASINAQEKRITNISYEHPIFKNVFAKKVSNFQYPKVNHFLSLKNTLINSILSYEDNTPFLINSANTYLFTAAINLKTSNFQNSPLIVPTFYNIAKQSLKTSELYYTIGNENSFDVNTIVQEDHILKLTNKSHDIIPLQQPFSDKVRITTLEQPKEKGIYTIKNNEVAIKNVSFNYSRTESDLAYINVEDSGATSIENSVPNVFKTLKSYSKINELWKWFVIFALILLIIEMLILKYLK